MTERSAQPGMRTRARKRDYARTHACTQARVHAYVEARRGTNPGARNKPDTAGFTRANARARSPGRPSSRRRAPSSCIHAPLTHALFEKHFVFVSHGLPQKDTRTLSWFRRPSARI
eukprot:2601638-Pleurochrysis_carterae.AAC.5